MDDTQVKVVETSGALAQVQAVVPNNTISYCIHCHNTQSTKAPSLFLLKNVFDRTS